MQIVATGTLTEWRVRYEEGQDADPDFRWQDDLDTFVDVADGESEHGYDMPHALREAWPVDNEDIDYMSPFEYGSVLHFERLRIDAKTVAESRTV
jgi:hypothetical protein